MAAHKPSLERPWWAPVAIPLILANINCLPIDKAELDTLPESLKERACPATTTPPGRRDSGDEPAEPQNYVTPTRRLAVDEYPVFKDDLDFEWLDIAVHRQLERFNHRELKGTIQLGQDRFPLHAMKDSLVRFSALLRRVQRCLRQAEDKQKDACRQDFADSIKQKYAVYVPALEPGDPRFGEPEPVLYTGYYTPHLEVSTKPDATFKVPIFKKPTDEWVSRMGRFSIDFRDGLEGKGLELFWAKDRFDVYLLHLEGGGRVTFETANGQTASTYLSFAGSNRRQWRFLSAYMLDKGWITEPSINFQREFINNNPALEAEIFSFCPGYVFFRTTTHPPEGADVVPLTDNRSIATDINHYRFKGMLAFVSAKRPRPQLSGDKDIEMMPFSRFVLDQDTGGAIKGKGRVDFYFGEGAYAELAANTLKQRGNLYFLMLKPD